MARILNLFSENEAEIQYTRAELDLLIKPYIDDLRKEFEAKFNKVSEISESVMFLIEENKYIRNYLRGFDVAKINENENKINILLKSLNQDFIITLKDE